MRGDAAGARDDGLKNLRIMIPFCRRVEEAKRVLEVMAKHGLERGKDGLEIYVMCEIPNNVLLIDEFAALFDGFSIGSNDLTQLVLGVDRDSELVAFGFDERDPGVLENAEARRGGCEAQWPPRWYLRPSPFRLPRDRGVSGASRDRLHQPLARYRASHHACHRGARKEARPEGPRQNCLSSRGRLLNGSRSRCGRSPDAKSVMQLTEVRVAEGAQGSSPTS